jgi:hypothetical protein
MAQCATSRSLIHCSIGGISRRQVLKLWPPLGRMIDEILVTFVSCTLLS